MTCSLALGPFSMGPGPWHETRGCCIICLMCRNIRVLHNFVPPTTKEEIRAAALQYVRKVSGLNKPSAADSDAFERAIDTVGAATEHLLASLQARVPVRSREGEAQKARLRWKQREARLPRPAR